MRFCTASLNWKTNSNGRSLPIPVQEFNQNSLRYTRKFPVACKCTIQMFICLFARLRLNELKVQICINVTINYK